MPVRCGRELPQVKFLYNSLGFLITYLCQVVRPRGFKVHSIPSLPGQGEYEVDVDNTNQVLY